MGVNDLLLLKPILKNLVSDDYHTTFFLTHLFLPSCRTVCENPSITLGFTGTALSPLRFCQDESQRDPRHAQLSIYHHIKSTRHPPTPLSPPSRFIPHHPTSRLSILALFLLLLNKSPLRHNNLSSRLRRQSRTGWPPELTPAKVPAACFPLSLWPPFNQSQSKEKQRRQKDLDWCPHVRLTERCWA